ncbi:MAG: ketoacyl-ACP synthase III [Armatimonadota bacterium]
MQATFSDVTIAAVATALPRETLDLMTLSAEFGADYLERALQSTGIRTLRIAPPGVCASDLCAAAARHLFGECSVDPGSLDALVFVSQTPDWITPATSHALQHRLGLPTTVAAFDLNYGCSGYIYGLLQAAMLVQSGCRRVLVCTGDTLTRLVNPLDKAMRLVIGDAGNATLVEQGDGRMTFTIGADGAGAPFLMIPAGGSRSPRSAQSAITRERPDGNSRSDEDMFMDGMEVMRFAVMTVPPLIESALALAGWSKDQVGYFILHQANLLILETIRKRLRVPAETVPVVLRDTGNTGPSSIPLALSLLANATSGERWDKTVLCGFGVGLSWGAATANLASARLLSPIEL